jgi:hypothetical protein
MKSKQKRALLYVTLHPFFAVGFTDSLGITVSTPQAF